MAKITIGRNNVGAGDKMQTNIDNYGRSTHDIGYIFKSTQSMGTVVPFLVELITKDTTLEINLQARINSQATLGPVFASAKAQYDVFLWPIRLGIPKLQNNTTNIGRKMDEVYFPHVQLWAQPFDFESPGFVDGLDIDNSQINPSSILKYLGISGVGNLKELEDPQSRDFPMLELIAYWDLIKDFYANKQEKQAAVIHTPQKTIFATITEIEVSSIAGSVILPVAPGTNFTNLISGSQIVIQYTGTAPSLDTVMLNTTFGQRIPISQVVTVTATGAGTITASVHTTLIGVVNYNYRGQTEIQQGPIDVTLFPLENIDKMRETLLANVLNTGPYFINDLDLPPYNLILNDLDDSTGNQTSLLSSQEGLALKCYQNDLFNNWLNTEWIEEINEQSAITVNAGQVTIDQIILGYKMFDVMNRIATADDSYESYMDAVYSFENKWTKNMGLYVGGLSKEIVFQEILSTAEGTSSTSQPVGSLAGTTRFNEKHKGGHVIVKANEICLVIGLTSFTPRIDYSQGNHWRTAVKSVGDVHIPGYDAIGFMDDINEYRAWWSTWFDAGPDNTWKQSAAGKLPSWTHYMTNVNRSYGNFARRNDSMFMTFNRQYNNAGPGSVEEEIIDLTAYINPAKYNYIFAQTSLDSQNYYHQIAVDMERRALMSAKQMPNLK